MNTENETQPEGTGKKWLIISIIFILVAINGIQLYLQSLTKEEVKIKTEEIALKDEKIGQYVTTVDSFEIQMQLRMDEITKLGGDTMELSKIIKQLKTDKSRLAFAKRSTDQLFSKLKTKYDSILESNDSKISNFKSERDALQRENETLKLSQSDLNDSLKELRTVKEQLNQKLSLAKSLHVSNIKVMSINKKGEESDINGLKARKIENIKINFVVDENPLTDPGSQTIYIKISEPDGVGVYNTTAGGGTVDIDGKSISYSVKQDFNYNRAEQNISINYAKGADYKAGRYLIDVYCGTKLCGKSNFTLK